MKIGIVNPYSWDVPGGVQFHIRDFALELLERGHEVKVLTPAKNTTDLPEWITAVGSSVAIPFNGSVARLSFSPIANARTKKWLEEGDFDVLHVHEPEVPSISMLALRAATVPVIGTFHAALDYSFSRSVSSPALDPLLEKLAARIAVSAEARRTLVEHHGGDAVIIPNGVDTRFFAEAEPKEEWAATVDRPVVVFLGRLDEPRKGLPVFADAIDAVLQEVPGARFLIAGRGGAHEFQKQLERFGDSVEFLGGVSDEDKASLLKGATVYVAPQTGGESFGIVLVEAMAAGCTVLASDLEAFRAVLDQGESGALFATGDSADLAHQLVALLKDSERCSALAQRGLNASRRYGWDTVTDQVLALYQTVLVSAQGQPADPSALDLLRGRNGGDDSE